MAVTSLNHHLDAEWLKTAYDLTRKDGAPGIDGQTATEYEKHLEEHLTDLLRRLKSGCYKAPPVRRAYVPKVDGSKRPLGIPTFEDKVAQRAIAMLLEPIYEQDFKPFSYGFRPERSAHGALRDLRSAIMEQGLRWVLDVDLRKYFDTIDHGHLRSFLDRRVKDGVVRRLIDKWLKAGVLESGQVRRSEVGTPQGGVISPLLANIFLHHVLDEWFEAQVLPRMKGRCVLIRYCDDFVIAFEDLDDCRRVFAVLGKRMSRFGLSVHEEKTRVIDFRFKRPGGIAHPSTAGTTFDFLGFTHVWGKSTRGKNVVYQVTAKARFARSVGAVEDWCKRNRHRPLADQWRRLSRALHGQYGYYGITGNSKRLGWYAHQIERVWHRWLSRRHRGGAMRWDRFAGVLKRYPLPPPRIVHRYATSSSEPAPRRTGCANRARPDL